MDAPPLLIRVRCPSISPSPVQLEGCTAQTTFKNFQAAVLSTLGLDKKSPGDGDEPCPAILAGFPPRPLDLAQDAAIGSTLSHNETVTVRLATPSASGANPEGGKWGRSKRQGKSASSSLPSSSAPTSRATRSSRSASSGADGKTAGSGGGSAAPPTPAERSTADKGKGKSKEKNAAGGNSSVKPKPATKETGGGGGGGGSSSGRGGGRGGVHTLGGRLTQSPSYSHSAAASRAAGNNSSPKGRMRTLFGGSSGSASGSRNPSEALQDAGGSVEAVASATPEGDTDGPARKRVRRGTGLALKNEGDIADRLLQAVGGGGKGTADRFFRKAMKLAVDKQYDQSRADARVRAAMGGWYTSSANAMQRRLGDGESVALCVSFSKGDGAKSRFEETVDRIPREQVAAVVRMIAREPESREMLKPHNFAGASPRMFWSLVEHWGGDVPAALRAAAPDVDWSFLDTRDRKPSEKAVANAIAEEVQRMEAEEERNEKKMLMEAKKKERERKKRRKEGILSDSSDDEPEPPPPVAAAPTGNSSETEAAAADTSVAVPVSSAEARQRAANAALARLTASQSRPRPDAAANTGSGGSASNGGVATSAVEAGAGAGATGEAVLAAAAARSDDGPREGAHEGEGAVDELDIEGLTEVAGEAGAKLLVAAGVRTLGELADRDEEDLARQLGVLQEGVRRQGPAASTGGGEDGGAGDTVVGAEKVSEWVQEARGDELDEIMADIVGGDEDVVEALEQVSVSTPRDLVRLGAFPDVLVGAVRERLGAERFTPLEGRITATAVESWRAKGDRLLEQRPWLELWVHEG